MAIPKSVKELQSFLGFFGYYRWFIRDYGSLAKPLIDLFKKNGWCWTNHTTATFQALKQTICSTPVIVLLNFQLEFTVDTNVSGFRVGVVLQ